MRDSVPLSAAIAVSLSHKPRQGGLGFVFLQYPLGLRRLGYDIILLDRLDAEMSVDADGSRCLPERSENLRYASRVVRRFDLHHSSSVVYDGGRRFLGLPKSEVLARVRRSGMLINVMGILDNLAIMQTVRRRVFLDIDPGFPQMWKELGLTDVFEGHDAFVTIGENIGKPGCEIPTSGLDWITTKQPIVLDEWPKQDGPGDAWTSVASWRGAYGPVDFKGKRYGLRVHEFRKFVELPKITGRTFRLALDIHHDEVNDLALLEKNGWELLDPKEVAGDPWSYRSFVQSSRAEFGVAKNMYVETKGGWFSDRSICYLASGRPVLVQDTGIRDLYPTGEGLLTYSSLEEAAAGVDEIERNYAKHARAAREIAEEFFDSDKVLTRLLEKLAID